MMDDFTTRPQGASLCLDHPRFSGGKRTPFFLQFPEFRRSLVSCRLSLLPSFSAPTTPLSVPPSCFEFVGRCLFSFPCLFCSSSASPPANLHPEYYKGNKSAASLVLALRLLLVDPLALAMIVCRSLILIAIPSVDQFGVLPPRSSAESAPLPALCLMHPVAGFTNFLLFRRVADTNPSR